MKLLGAYVGGFCGGVFCFCGILFGRVENGVCFRCILFGRVENGVCFRCILF